MSDCTIIGGASIEFASLQSVQHNGSLWADIFLTMGNMSPNPQDPTFDARGVFHKRKRAYLFPAYLSRTPI